VLHEVSFLWYAQDILFHITPTLRRERTALKGLDASPLAVQSSCILQSQIQTPSELCLSSRNGAKPQIASFYISCNTCILYSHHHHHHQSVTTHGTISRLQCVRVCSMVVLEGCRYRAGC